MIESLRTGATRFHEVPVPQRSGRQCWRGDEIPAAAAERGPLNGRADPSYSRIGLHPDNKVRPSFVGLRQAKLSEELGSEEKAPEPSVVFKALRVTSRTVPSTRAVKPQLVTLTRLALIGDAKGVVVRLSRIVPLVPARSGPAAPNRHCRGISRTPGPDGAGHHCDGGQAGSTRGRRSMTCRMP